ncbi:DUF7848 domain-containing protein [Streptomyces cyaneofuscatus]
MSRPSGHRVTFEAEYLWCDRQATTPSIDSEPVDAECMSHTGRSGHQSFRRLRTLFAMVVRAERPRLQLEGVLLGGLVDLFGQGP